MSASSTAEMNISRILLNTTNEVVHRDRQIGSALTSAFLLSITMLVGITSNIAGLCTILTKNWRNHLVFIQLLITSTVVCTILAPMQIIRISLSFTSYEFQPLCHIQHFIHLHVDSCTFVTLLIITYDRLQRIYKNTPHISVLTSKKVIACCTWLLILPIAVHIMYKEFTTPASISIFSYDCLITRLHITSDHTVDLVAAIISIMVLVAITTMYLLAICQLHKKMSSRVGSIYPNLTDHPIPPTPLRVLQPREATTSRNSIVNSFNWFECPTPTRSRAQSMINLYNVPLKETRVNSEEAMNFQRVLNEFRTRYVEIQSNKQTEPGNDLSHNQLIRLRKLSETYQNQARHKAKSSIANALGKITNISLFSFEDEVKNRCDITLNPLKHTRRSAGNVWHEDGTNSTRRSAGNVWHEDTTNSNCLKPQTLKKKKKLPRKVHPKLKKQGSVDSIGTFSDTSGIVDSRTDSDISSITYFTESNQSHHDDGSSIISVIIEQPEPESGLSRQHSTVENTVESKELNNGRHLFVDSKTTGESSMRPRCHSASFKSGDKSVILVEESFRKRAYTEGSKPDKTKIKKFLKRRGRRHRKNKNLPPLKNSPNSLTSENRGRFYSSTDCSCSDSCQEYDKPQNKSLYKSPKIHTETIPKEKKGSFSSEYCESNMQGSSNMSDSITNIQSCCETPRKINKGQVDSTTQTLKTRETNVKNSDTTNSCPTICITEDSNDKQIRGKQNNWFPAKSEICQNQSPGKISQLQVSQGRSPSISMSSLRSAGNYRQDTRQTTKRSIIIIMSLALCYLPMCITVFLLNSISTEVGLFLLQISRSIQYLYFSIIPTIYVHTNQGLQKTLNKPPRG